MNFEFAKYHDITEVAKKHSPENYNPYEKIFLCVDVNDFWIARVQSGYGEDYERDEDAWMVERNNIGKEARSQKITSLRDLKKVLDLDIEDGLSNWDYHVGQSMEEVVDMLNDGFGFGEPITA